VGTAQQFSHQLAASTTNKRKMPTKKPTAHDGETLLLTHDIACKLLAFGSSSGNRPTSVAN